MGLTGMEVTALGFGAAEIGFQKIDEKIVSTLLNGALDAGLNVIDTAECYGSEEVIGKTLSGRRDEYHLFTKCGHSAGIDLPDWDPALLGQSIDRSLRLLQTDHLDLVLLHSCSKDLLKKGEVIEVLRRAKTAGKTRFMGYSGDSVDALYAVNSGAFDVLETSLNIADQESITLTLPITRQKEMGVIIKRPIANAAWIKGKSPDYYGHVYWERLQKLQYDFIKSDPQSAVEKALRFTLGFAGVHTAIVGSINPQRWVQNAAYAEKGPLSDEEINVIRSRWTEAAEPEWVGQE